jgi:hypothetical protein
MEGSSKHFFFASAKAGCMHDDGGGFSLSLPGTLHPDPCSS